MDRDVNNRDDRLVADGTRRQPSHPIASEDEASTSFRDDKHPSGGYAGSSDVYPMRMLLRESDAVDSGHFSSRSPEDASATSDDLSSKKRNRAVTNRDDYLQLPQPFKKPKPAVHASVVPPIINGLHEPPPDAALFPPIASDSFTERDAARLETLHSSRRSTSNSANQRISTESDKSQNTARKRVTRPRRKWSDEETNHLLLGVSKHGVGKWRTILDDPQFRFNGRSAGDLKDRFRTCCPAELRDSRGEGKDCTPIRAQQPKPKKGLHAENILHDDGDSTLPGMITPPTEPETSTKTKKTRAHRKKMEDLENLGIHAPFKKSLRRERCPFTEQDDREILEGLEKYGPAWTKILRDPSFHLSTRRPTDLRDRVRNRYPSIYQRIEKGAYHAKDGTRGNDIMEPSVTMTIENSLHPSNQISRRGSREELPHVTMMPTDPTDRNSSAQAFDLGDTSTSQWLGGEMGISRLLLDDSK